MAARFANKPRRLFVTGQHKISLHRTNNLAGVNSKILSGHFHNNTEITMSEGKVIALNKKAWHDYFIEDRFEAGIALTGTEVKSLRRGKVNLNDSYIVIKNKEAYLLQAHISQYEEGNIFNHEPRRSRKLLLHKYEIDKLFSKTVEKGYSLIPVKLYFLKGRVKIEFALAKGKKLYDKRDSISEKEAKRDIERGMRN